MTAVVVAAFLMLQCPVAPTTPAERMNCVLRELEIGRQSDSERAIRERLQRQRRQSACIEAIDREDKALHALRGAAEAAKTDNIHMLLNPDHWKLFDKATRAAEKAIKATRQACFSK